MAEEGERLLNISRQFIIQIKGFVHKIVHNISWDIFTLCPPFSI